jgi:hypothetical protein
MQAGEIVHVFEKFSDRSPQVVKVTICTAIDLLMFQCFY